MKKEPWWLVTGQPGCGKTTLLKKVVGAMTSSGASISGFVTEEHVSGGKRDGFDVVTIPGPSKRAKFASKTKSEANREHRTGPYFVDVKSFDKSALPSIQGQSDAIVVIDEIGRMELHSAEFRQQVKHLLNKSLPLFGSIAAPRYGHVVPFCESIKRDARVKLYHLKPSNRAVVEQAMIADMKRWWLHSTRLKRSLPVAKSSRSRRAKSNLLKRKKKT